MSDIPPASSTPPADSAPPAPPRRRRRRWLRLLLALPVLLLVIVLLAPTLLSLGAVRAMLLPSVSSAVAPHGKLDVADWRFAWFGGQRLDGIRLLDDQNAVVAHLNLKTDASLLALARRDYDFGETVLDGDFDLRIDPATNRINLMHIVGADEPSPAGGKRDSKPSRKKEESPLQLANLKGKITLNLTGTISSTNRDHPNAIPFTKLEKGQVVVDLNDIENQIGLDGAVALDIAGKSATLTFKGSTDVIEKSLLVTDPAQIDAGFVAAIDGIDLAIVKTVLIALGNTSLDDAELAGLLKGKLVVDWKRGGEGVIRAESLGIDDLVFAGPQLRGDTLRLKRVDVPLEIRRPAGGDGVAIDALGIRTDLAGIAVTGSITQEAIDNLIAGNAPGSTGQLSIQTDIPDAAALTRMLPNLARLQQDVAVTAGGLKNDVTIDVRADGLKVTQSARLSAEGTAAGKPIRLDEVRLDASADLNLADGKPIDLASIRQMAFALNAASFGSITGEGVPEKVKVIGRLDLTRLYEQVAQFVDTGDVRVNGQADFALNTAGLPTDPAEPLGLDASFNLRDLILSAGGKTYFDRETVTGAVDLLYKESKDARTSKTLPTITFSKLAVRSQSGTFDLNMVGDSAWVSFADGIPFGEATITFGAALDRLLKPVLAEVDPQYRLERGRLGSTITLGFDPAKQEYSLILDGKVDRTTVGTLLREETIGIGAKVYVNEDLSRARAWVELASAFANVKLDDVDLSLPADEKASPFGLVNNLTLTGSASSLAKLHGLIASLSPAETAGDALPPLRVENGSATFDGSLKRDPASGTIAVTLNVPAIRDLALSRGGESYRQREPITLAVAADLVTDTSAATPMEQLRQILVRRLDADVPGVARITMPEPIELSNLAADNPSAKGTVRVDVTPAAGEWVKVATGSEMPIRASFRAEQRITTSGDELALAGTITASDLQPTGPDAASLPPELRTIEIRNDLTADLKSMAAAIRTLELVAPQAREALSIRVRGGVREIGTQNIFDDVVATVAYDLQKVWPVVRPFIDPTGQTLGRVETAGRYEQPFTLRGRYPLVDGDKPVEFKTAIRSLELAGDLRIDRFNLRDYGVDITELAVPLTLKGGVVRTSYADGSTPKPFKVNGGEGNVGGLTVDLTAGEPLLGNVKDYRLVTNATINPILSDALGKYFNPLFPNATEASGLLSIRASTNRLYLGPALLTPNSGKATVALTLTDMELANPINEQLLGGMINKVAGTFGRGGVNTDVANFTGELRDALFTLDQGVLTQDATFMIGSIDTDPTDGRKPTLYPFRFTGDVRLSDQRMNLRAGLPLQMVRDRVKADWAKYLPDSWPVEFTGTTKQPRINFAGDFGKLTAEIAAKMAADRVLKNTPDGKSPEDLLGGILNQIPGIRRDDKSRDEAKDQPARDEKPREPPPAEPKKQTKADKAREEARKREEEAARKREEEAKKREEETRRRR